MYPWNKYLCYPAAVHTYGITKGGVIVGGVSSRDTGRRLAALGALPAASISLLTHRRITWIQKQCYQEYRHCRETIL